MCPPLVRPMLAAWRECDGRPAAELEVMERNSWALHASGSALGSAAKLRGSPASAVGAPRALCGTNSPCTCTTNLSETMDRHRDLATKYHNFCGPAKGGGRWHSLLYVQLCVRDRLFHVSHVYCVLSDDQIQA